jgi:hypothetical protein
MSSTESQGALQSTDEKRRRRWPWALGVIVAILYLASVFFYNRSLPVDLGNATVRPSADGIGVYFGMQDIELTSDRITADMFVVLGNELIECNPMCGLSKDVALALGPASQSQIRLPRGTPDGYAMEIELFLTGAPYTYPFDSHESSIFVTAVVLESDGSASELPLLVEFLVPEGFVGWHIELNYPTGASGVALDDDTIERVRQGLGSSEIANHPSTKSNGQNWAYMTMERAFSTQAISLIILILMILLAGLAVVSSYEVQVGKRSGGRWDNDFSMAGWLVGSLFAMPALRALLPDAPPIGSWIDILVFFWVEIATMMALATFVLFWVRQKPNKNLEPEGK